MDKVDEWSSLFPPTMEKGGSLDQEGPADRPRSIETVPLPPKAQGVESLQAALGRFKPAPLSVHLYRGEGFHWIRLSFDSDNLIPKMVRKIGKVIQRSVPGEMVYFHALRPHDIFFFVDRGDEDDRGLPPASYGVLVDELSPDWG